jgi:hypothetical protein
MLFLLAYVLLGAVVSANKGPNQTLYVYNNTGHQIGAAIDGPASLVTDLNSANITQFQADGGTVLNPGQFINSGVQVGSHTVLAADLTQKSSTGGLEYITESVSVSANQTVNVYVKPGVSGAYPTIYFSATP